MLTEQVWTASPRSCRAGAFLNTGFLPGAGTSCHLTDGGWEDAIRGSPGLQSVIYKLHLCSGNRTMTIATVQPLIGVLPKPAHGSGTRGENVQVTLYSYWTTVTVERYRNWTLARETLDKDILKFWSNIHIYEYCTIVHTYIHSLTNASKREKMSVCQDCSCLCGAPVHIETHILTKRFRMENITTWKNSLEWESKEQTPFVWKCRASSFCNFFL